VKKVTLLICSLVLALLAFMASLPKRYWDASVNSGMLKKTTTVAPMALLAYQPKDATIVVTQSSTTTFAAAVQLLGSNGKDLTFAAAVDWYLSTQSDGSDLAADSTDITSLAISGDGLCIEHDANVAGKLVSEDDGDINLAIVVPSGKTVYLVLVMPDGSLVISDAMTYGM